jgi:hypothetical protein
MENANEQVPSLRARIVLYLIGVAAMALPWGYLLFVRPWLRARRGASAVTHSPLVAILALLALFH